LAIFAGLRKTAVLGRCAVMDLALEIELATAAARAARARQSQEQESAERRPSGTEFFFRGAYDALLSPADLVTYPVRAISEALGVDMPAPSTTVANLVRGAGGAVAPEGVQAESRGERVAELAGGGLGFVAPGFGAAQMLSRYGGPVAGAIGQQMVSGYRAAPATVAGAEIAAGAGAGLLGFEGERAAEEAGLPPELGRGVGELAGGLVGAGVPTVTGMAARGVGNLMDAIPGVRTARRVGTQLVNPEAAAFERASEALTSRLETTPEAAINALYGDTILDLTPAQRVGQDRLLKLEQDILKTDPQLDARFRETREAAQRTATTEMQAVGEGGAITDTVRAMDDWVSTSREVLENTAAQAVQRAEDAINRAGPTNMMGQSERSVVFRDALEQSYRQVRNEESKLWEAVPSGQTSPTSQAEEAFQIALAQATDVSADRIPATARRWLDPDSPDYFAGAASIPEVRRLMSDLREDARTARAAGQAFTAKLADDIAEATLRDLESIPGVGGPLDAARAFSREFNQVYRTGPIAEVLGTSRTGGDRVAAEETLRRLFGRTGEGLVARAGAVEAAIGPDAPTGGRSALAGQQASDYLRRDFQDTIMDEAGNIRLRQAENFVAKRREFLDKYPALGSLMDDAVTAARDAQTTQRTVESELAALRTSPAQKLSNAPEHNEFASILQTSQNPAQDFFTLREIAEQAGQPAVDGLKSSAAAFLLRGATDTVDGQAAISGNKIINALQEQRTVDAMSAVLDPEELGNIRQIADELLLFELSAKARRGGTDELIPPTPVDTVLALASRVLGAFVARKVTPEGAATIQNPQIGASAAKGLMRHLTNAEATKLLVDATTDPDLMRALLIGKRPMTPDELSRTTRVVQRWMTNNLSRVAIDADDALEDFKRGLGLPEVNLPNPVLDPTDPFWAR
jgi:hypothetical protein